ncbi:MAG: hypothetical protein FWD48_10250 [Oscillospiraceae bacterium]|nr:hypothetical protein [Oscillospiraceae bacterium]
MFCSKCGVGLGEGNIFCHSCGAKVIAVGCDVPGEPESPEAPEIQEAALPETTPSGYACHPSTEGNEPVPVPEEVFRAIELLEAAPIAEPAAFAKEEREKAKKEKEYFGLPALIFCLTIIAMLSAACGVLSMLYFGGL